MGFRLGGPGKASITTITTSTEGQGDDFRQGQSWAQGQAQRQECEACSLIFYFILFSEDIISSGTEFGV